MDATAELARLREALAELVTWADDKLNDGHDRQYIAEHLTASVNALITGTTPPTAPF